MRLLAVDPSLTSSGWALFSLDNGRPQAVGVLSPPGPEELLARRLEFLQREVDSLLSEYRLSRDDILVCEGPAPLVLNPNSALKVERVRGIFETTARARGLSVPGRINPRTVQTELLGLRGKQLARKEVKASARAIAEKLYVLDGLPRRGVKTHGPVCQDIIDALLIGSIAVGKAQIGLRGDLPLEQAFDELKRSNWRQNGRRAASGWRNADLARLRK